MATAAARKPPTREPMLAALGLTLVFLQARLLGPPAAVMPELARAGLLLVVGGSLLLWMAPRLEPSQEGPLGTGRVRFGLALAPAVLLLQALGALRLALAVGPDGVGDLETGLVLLAVAACLRSEHLGALGAWMLALPLGEALAHACGWAGLYATTAVYAHLAVSVVGVALGTRLQDQVPFSVAEGLVGGCGAAVLAQLLILGSFGAAFLGRPELVWIPWIFLGLHLVAIPGLYLLGRRQGMALPRVIAVVAVVAWVRLGSERLGAPGNLAALLGMATAMALMVVLEPAGLGGWEEDPTQDAGYAADFQARQGAAARVSLLLLLGLAALAAGRGAANRGGGTTGVLVAPMPAGPLPARLDLRLGEVVLRHTVEPGGELAGWLVRPEFDPGEGALTLDLILDAPGAAPPPEAGEAGALELRVRRYCAWNGKGEPVWMTPLRVRSRFELPAAWRQAGRAGRALLFTRGALGDPFPAAMRESDQAPGGGWLGGPALGSEAQAPQP